MKNKHAFPFKRTAHNSNEKISCDGMTLRQYYAAMAMKALLTSEGPLVAHSVIAKMAFEMADAMIEAEE